MMIEYIPSDACYVYVNLFDKKALEVSTNVIKVK